MSSESSSLDGAAVAKKGTPGGRTESEVRLQPTGEEHLAFWLERLEKPSFVYVIQPEGDSPIKIGRAVDVRKRLAGLQTGNPRRLQLLYVVPGDNELEWQLHYRLRPSRLTGEWFGGEETESFLRFAHDLAQFFTYIPSL